MSSSSISTPSSPNTPIISDAKTQSDKKTNVTSDKKTDVSSDKKTDNVSESSPKIPDSAPKVDTTTVSSTEAETTTGGTLKISKKSSSFSIVGPLIIGIIFIAIIFLIIYFSFYGNKIEESQLPAFPYRYIPLKTFIF